MNTVRTIIVILFVGFFTFIIGYIVHKKRVSVHSCDKTLITKSKFKHNKLLDEIEHYWVGYDFSDSLLVANTDISEQAFVNFIVLIANTAQEERCRIIDNFYNQTVNQSFAYNNFIMLAEKYLYHPNSPYRNEEMYIPVLKHIINNPQIDSLHKIRPRYQLEMAMKNRPNEIAANFTYILPNGTKGELHKIKSEYILVFFNNPDCSDCNRVKEILSTETIFAKNLKIKILAVYPDENLSLWNKTPYPTMWINVRCREVMNHNIYDLKAIPTLYLLDKDKRVLLKDAPVEIVGAWLQQNIE